jgi:pyridinium-3,5-bisthiocarboxylic acid mononucleotide nickel chelatase
VTGVAYVNCSAGVAGDMLLGALVHAGADRDHVAAAIASLRLDGYALTFESTQRGGVAATLANVVTADRGDHTHRPVRVILDLLANAKLTDAIRSRAARVFTALAVAEGAVHGIDPDEVELHEVGALDAIIDVVGIAAALDDLGVDRLVASPVAVGHGIVRAAHGELPNPPPAVVRLAASRKVPLIGIDTTMEVATPTGVAVLVALADEFGPLPPMTVDTIGYGAGTADPPGRPNVVQLIVGQTIEPSLTPRHGRRGVELAVNVDDVTGEVLAHTIAALMAAGAHDAWATPIVMKKGRPAHTVHALADPADVERLAEILLAETGSLGIRATTVERWPQRRTEVIVDVDGHAVRVKLGGGRAKAEHDDAAAAAAELRRPLRDVLRQAESAAANEYGSS